MKYEGLTGIDHTSWIILCMRPANEIWHYSVTPSLSGRAHTQNDPWYMDENMQICMIYMVC